MGFFVQPHPAWMGLYFAFLHIPLEILVTFAGLKTQNKQHLLKDLNGRGVLLY